MNTLIAGHNGAASSSATKTIPVRVDNNGAILTVVTPNASATNVSTTDPVYHKQISATAARLTNLTIFNTAATDVLVQLHDAATTPAEGAKTPLTILALAGMLIPWPLSACGRSFSAGIYLCASSTAATKTLDTSATLSIDAQII